MQLLIASGNAGKLSEIADILGAAGVGSMPIGDLCFGFDIDESGASFLANSVLKVVGAYRACGFPSVADDSGLCVDGLNGEPGVYSARYAGPGKSDTERVAHLLGKMQGFSAAQRRARFECVCAAIIPRLWLATGHGLEEISGLKLEADMVCVAARGQVRGSIGLEPRGSGGFGYDPVFLPDETPGLTLAEVESSLKNQLSHRARAFRRLVGALALPGTCSYTAGISTLV